MTLTKNVGPQQRHQIWPRSYLTK